MSPTVGGVWLAVGQAAGRRGMATRRLGVWSIPPPLAPEKADKRTIFRGAQRSLRRQNQLCDPETDVRLNDLERPLWVDCVERLGAVHRLGNNGVVEALKANLRVVVSCYCGLILRL